MCLDLLDVVEVGLPVLDDARLVCREEPVVGVCVGDAADGRLVGLHDGLEVEAHAVPEGELSAGGAGEQAAALGGPLDHVDGVLDLVQRRVQGLCGYRFGGVGDAGGGRGHVHDVAGAGALDLRVQLVLVARLAAAHPLHRGGSIVGDGACLQVKLAVALRDRQKARAGARETHAWVVGAAGRRIGGSRPWRRGEPRMGGGGRGRHQVGMGSVSTRAACFVVAVASFELGFAKAVLGHFHSHCWLAALPMDTSTSHCAAPLHRCRATKYRLGCAGGWWCRESHTQAAPPGPLTSAGPSLVTGCAAMREYMHRADSPRIARLNTSALGIPISLC